MVFVADINDFIFGLDYLLVYYGTLDIECHVLRLGDEALELSKPAVIIY